eukprot:COSAG02_NODE_6430_length_3572_cov_8.968129_5_plen_273_part_01
MWCARRRMEALALDPALDEPEAAPLMVLAELRVGEVRLCAVGLGCPEDEVDEADEADDERACLTGLAEDRLEALRTMKLKDLRAEVIRRTGLTREQVDDYCGGADDRKAAMVQLMFSNVVTGVRARTSMRTSSTPPPERALAESPTPSSKRWTPHRLMNESPERTSALQEAIEAQHARRWTLSESELGRGGNGVVFACEDKRLGQVAIKFVQADDPQKMQREAALMQRVAHPHICKYYEHFLLSGGLFGFVLELLDGGSLAQLAERAGGQIAE